MATKIPLAVRLKKESHRKIAAAQDLIVREVYALFRRPVLHGGTAIWRCYVGRRFSEDLDFYIPKESEKIAAVFVALEKVGFKVLKKKVSENSVYSELAFDRITVRFEATFQHIQGTLCDYENVDGTFLSIFSLTPESFIKEKIAAYLKRKKIRDLYDLYFLTNFVTDPYSLVRDFQEFFRSYEKPVDEQDLRILILEGTIPTSEELLEYLKRKWLRKNT